MSLARFESSSQAGSRGSSSPAIAYTNEDLESLRISLKQYRDRMQALERAVSNFHSEQSGLNERVTGRMGQLETDVRNNRAFQEESDRERNRRVAGLEHDRDSWSRELDRLESAAREKKESREGKEAEMKDEDEKARKRMEELKELMKESKERIAWQRKGVLATSVGVLLIGMYVRNTI